MTVVEDVTITEEALVVDLVVEEVLLQEEKEVLLQEEKDQAADLEATEVLLLEKVVLDQEVHQLQEQVVFHLTEPQDLKVHLIELQDVLKALVIHQDLEDQEETNNSDC
jgi:Rps23 Pro-64 3,4-dihydroxylase Tpa1-like proline 4-hydroxylase